MKINRFIPVFCMDQAGDATGGGQSGGSAGIGSKVSVSTGGGDSAAASVSTTVGDAAKASQQQSSASASSPGLGQQTGGDTVTADFREGWSDEMKKDPYLSGFKTTADLAKALTDNKKLVGQKLGIPGADATPEAKAAFYEALGVPKEASGYDFKTPEKLPEALAKSYDQAHADKWAARMKELGIPKDAANALRNDFFAEISKELEGMQADVSTSEAEFDALATKVLGDKKEQAIQNASAILTKHVPKELLADLEKSGSNVALVALAAALNGELKTLTGEDNALSKDGGTTSGETVAQMRQRANDLMKDPAYNSPFAKGKDEHERLKKEVKDIYARIDAAMKK